MKTIICLSLLLISQVSVGQNAIVVDNSTGQAILRLDYWIGSETEAQNPNIIYKSKGAIDKDVHNFNIVESFHKTKRNTVLVKASLTGGGYLTSQYNISKDEKTAPIKLINPATKVPEDNFKTVIEKFKEFNFDKQYLKMTDQNALLSTLGAIWVLDSEEKKTLYIITPKELKTQMSKLCQHDNQDVATGTFSSATSIEGGLSLPFVSANTAFTNSDVVKFQWLIENAGECVWAPEGDKDLATLFSELSDKTKEALVQVYKDNPGAKLKFINKAYVIGRIELETIKSKSINSNTQVTGSSFVSIKGNYTFEDATASKNLIKNVITKVDGYYQTSLLSNLYLLNHAASKLQATEAEKGRIRNEFVYLLNLYPTQLNPTDDTEIMKRQIIELNKKLGGLTYLKKTEGTSTIALQDIKQQNDGIGEVKKTETSNN